MKTLNRYFFDSEEISRHDKFWFYGSYALWTLIVGLVVLTVRY